jgi:hypothetical protein
MNIERMFKLGLVVIALGWIVILMRLAFPPHKPTVSDGRYQGKRMSCLWDTYPPDGDYEVTHGSDGTRDGSYSFWKDGRLVTTCNLNKEN